MKSVLFLGECPVSGNKFKRKEDWFVASKDEFYATIGCLDKNILLAYVSGKTNLKYIQDFIALIVSVLKKENIVSDIVILIDGKDIEKPILHQRYLLNKFPFEDFPINGIVYYNVPFYVRIYSNWTNSLFLSKTDLSAVKTYRKALLFAETTRGKAVKRLFKSDASKSLITAIKSEDLDIFDKKSWKLKGDFGESSFKIIDSNILLLKISGMILSSDKINLINSLRIISETVMQFIPHRYFFIIDLRELKTLTTFKKNVFLLDDFILDTKEKKCKGIVILGNELLYKIVADYLFGKGFIENVFFAENTAESLEILKKIKKTGPLDSYQKSYNEGNFSASDSVEIFEFLNNFDWTDVSTLKMPSKTNPLYPFAEAFKLLKTDVASLLKERDMLNKKVKEQLVISEMNRKKAEESTILKTNFLSNISHELRTPLNGIIGLANISQFSEDINEIKEYMKDIQDSAEILLHLINDILDASKIEAKKMKLQEKKYNLKLLVNSVVSSLIPLRKNKDIEISLLFDDKIPKQIVGDDLRVRQILYNTIGNSLKFTDHGFIKITVSLKSQTEDFLEIEFIVEDSGVGIKKDKINTIFERFSQATPNFEKYGGTGLGLSIVKNFVEMMNGYVIVESEFGKGTKFIFTIRQKTYSSARQIDCKTS